MIEGFTVPAWSGNLRNLYWHLRCNRDWDDAKRRSYYRRIEKEVADLVQAGHDPESVRLFCRWLADPSWEPALFKYLEHIRHPSVTAATGLQGGGPGGFSIRGNGRVRPGRAKPISP